MKLFVTGGAGFIGSTFVGQRVAAGDEVIVYDLLTYAGHKENLDYIDDKNRFQLIAGDIRDSQRVLSLLKEHAIDRVVSFAAESHVDNSITGPGVFIETNVLGTYAMLEAARHYWSGLKGKKKDHFRYLQISTDEVYGSLALDAAEKFNEETPYKPSSPYSASKAGGDHLVHAWYHTYGLPTLITNCTNNYGPRQHPEKLIPHMITCALSGKPLPIYGDGKNVRDWIQVEDHCRGVFQALDLGKPGKTYCFSGNAERNNLQVVDTICEILDELRPKQEGGSYSDQKKFVTDRPGHDRRYAIDDSAAQQTLGFTHNFTFEEGLRHTIEWYLDNTAWVESINKKKAA